MFTFYLSNKVNTETAGYKSQNFQAFIYLAKSNQLLNCSHGDGDSTKIINCTLTIKLPIHVRYHSPKIPLGDACNESSLSLVSVAADPGDQNRTEQVNKNEDESAAVSGETNGYFRFNIRKPRLLFTSNCSFHVKQSTNKPPSKIMPVNSTKFVEFDLPCQKNKSVRNDYLFALSDEINATNRSAESIAKKYSSVCKWREYKFEKVSSFYLFFF